MMSRKVAQEVTAFACGLDGSGERPADTRAGEGLVGPGQVGDQQGAEWWEPGEQDLPLRRGWG